MLEKQTNNSTLCLNQYDTDLYTQLLLVFLKKQNDFQYRIEQEIFLQNFQRTYHLINSLKNASKKIGANNLYNAALDLELHCKQKCLDISMLSILITELNTVLTWIELLKDSIDHHS